MNLPEGLRIFLSDSPVVGLEHFLFFDIFGIIIPLDFHIFQRGRRNTTNQVELIKNLKYFEFPFVSQPSIGCFKGKNTGNSHISWENLWFPVNFPLSRPTAGALREDPQLAAETVSLREERFGGNPNWEGSRDFRGKVRSSGIHKNIKT